MLQTTTTFVSATKQHTTSTVHASLPPTPAAGRTHLINLAAVHSRSKKRAGDDDTDDDDAVDVKDGKGKPVTKALMAKLQAQIEHIEEGLHPV